MQKYKMNTRYIALLLLIFANSLFSQEEKQSAKDKEIEEVKVVKQKKPVEQRADRTIFDFSDQPQLNSGTLLEGLKKLPGLIVSDVAGMMYQGKQLEVFLDGRPLNISSNELNSFLEGMPANSVEKIEIITQPGAEFPATSGGAIVNIITSKKAKNYLSATYTNGYEFTNYDKFRNRVNNSILLNARNKYFSWQLNFGQNYRESALWSDLSRESIPQNITLSNTNSDRINRNYYVKSAVTFDIGKDRLLLNYDINLQNNNSISNAFGTGFTAIDQGNTNFSRKELVATYQKRFLKADQKLDFRVNYANTSNNFDLFSKVQNLTTLQNDFNQKYFNSKIDYNQAIPLFEKGKISTGVFYDRLDFITNSFQQTNLDYYRSTQAVYLEIQTSYKSFDFILGSRAENYSIEGKTTNGNLIPFNKSRIFPNASLQYNLIPQVFFSMNYNTKISLPSTSSLNPNNINYQNPNLTNVGNPQLDPTLFNNYEVKLSAFDYAFLSYSVSKATNQVATRVTLSNTNQVLSTSINVSDVRIENFNFGFPLPYMLFSKGLKETLKFDFNPDKINFLYLYLGHQKHYLPGIETKGFWIVNLSSQIILPKDVKFVANYSYATTKGNYFYFRAFDSFNHSLDLNFSKKFLKDQLTVSIDANDILNTNRQGFYSIDTPIQIRNKFDTRNYGISITYKIPTKNKLAKENPTLLNQEKKENNSILN